VIAGGASAPPVGRLGGEGTDYVAMLQHIGVPSADFGFGGAYPTYHSIYDNFRWMDLYGDPGFRRHKAMAQFLGVLALHLSAAPLLPFRYADYAAALGEAVGEVEALLKNATAPSTITLSPMRAAVADMAAAAAGAEAEAAALEAAGLKDPLAVRAHNDRLMSCERAFLDADGLPGRGWYKHLIYAPSEHNGYGSSTFPAVVDAVAEAAASPGAEEAWAAVQHEIWRGARVIGRAAKVLQARLS